MALCQNQGAVCAKITWSGGEDRVQPGLPFPDTSSLVFRGKMQLAVREGRGPVMGDWKKVTEGERVQKLEGQ